MLEARTWLPAWLGSAGILGYAARRVRSALADGTVVMMAVMAALIFALQMLNFPVAGGTSGHFAGGAAAAIVLGLWPAMLVMAAVLTIQALLFADGGITALGANMLTMAVLAPLVGRAIWLLARRARENRTLQLAGAFVAGWCATVAAALAAAVLLWLSGRVPLGPALGAMGIWHALIGLGEGGITAGLVGYLLAVRPDLLENAEPRAAGASARSAAIVLGGVALVAAALSFVASAFPDGLERVYSQLGSAVEGRPLLRGPLADYVMPGVGDDRLAVALAAVVGVVVTGTLVYTLLASLRRRRAEEDDRA
jgi:cobalt/nickel transport system permease protein